MPSVVYTSCSSALAKGQQHRRSIRGNGGGTSCSASTAPSEDLRRTVGSCQGFVPAFPSLEGWIAMTRSKASIARI